MAKNDFNIRFPRDGKIIIKGIELDVELLNVISILEKKKGKYILTRPVTEKELINAVRCLFLSRYLKPKHKIDSVKECKKYLQLALADYEQEVFCVLFLNANNMVLGFDKLFMGTINKVVIHLREVIRRVIKYNAAAVILVHNHPSGSVKPSKVDIRVTQKIAHLLSDIDVRVLDHIIVGRGGMMSLVESKLWYPTKIENISLCSSINER